MATNLSNEELTLISTILDKVAGVMIKNDDFGYVDNGDFLLNLDKSEMELLRGIVEKL